MFKKDGLWIKENLTGKAGVPAGEFVKTVMKPWVSLNEGNLLIK